MQAGVQLRVALALDERQHALVQRGRAHHVALALREVREVLCRRHLEVAVAARPRPAADGFEGERTVLEAPEDVGADLRDG